MCLEVENNQSYGTYGRAGKGKYVFSANKIFVQFDNRTIRFIGNYSKQILIAFQQHSSQTLSLKASTDIDGFYY